MSGIQPKRKVKIIWSPEFAYAIGLIATDGCLSKDGRHIDFTSKDILQVKTFLKCLGLKNKIGKKQSGSSTKRCDRVQFGDVMFYKFLLSIGFTSAKSKTMGELDIPQKYFFDFLRGHFDGDGSFYSYFDPRWKNSFMFYTVFISASKKHIDWLQDVLWRQVSVQGHITHSGHGGVYQLKYAKKESVIVLEKMYYDKNIVCLTRKRLKVERALGMIGSTLL
jgi:hypothetical protein